MDSFGISRRQYVGCISASDINKVKSAVVAVPVQNCQRWMVEVLAGLERKFLIPFGTSVHYHSQTEPSLAGETGDGWFLLSSTCQEELTIEEPGSN
jgi:hypothetical protein